jgi:GSCFA family
VLSWQLSLICCHRVMQITNDAVPPPCADQSIGSAPSNRCQFSTQPSSGASAAEAVNNYRGNPAAIWYKDNADANDPAGKYAFQRLRQTWFIPRVEPKFKLYRQDKFYAIGSCFARGIENALAARKMVVESAAPEFAKLQPVNTKGSGLGFTNKYNTYSILNELRWAIDPDAEFPRDSIVPLTKTTWYDPHTNPTLEFAGLEETLERRALMQAVTKRIRNCRAVVLTLGLAEVWRDVKANVFVNRTPMPSLFKTDPDRYEFQLSSFGENWANLEAIHALLSQYGHPDVHIIVTVSPVPLMNTFSMMDIVIANTWAKSLLRAVAQEWAAAHSNVDYFPSYEIVQNSDRAATWEADLRHVTGAAVQHIMDLFVRNYIE